MPIDYNGVWADMEEAQRLELTKAFRVSNFSTKKTQHLLSFATIPPSFNQVEMSPSWQQKKLRDFCKANGIVVTAFSPLGVAGTTWGTNQVLESKVLLMKLLRLGESLLLRFVLDGYIRLGQLLQ